MSTPTPQESSALPPAPAPDNDKRITIIEALEAPSKRLESMAELRAENRRLEKELAHQTDMASQAAVCGPKVALDEAIRRMEMVPVGDLGKILWNLRIQGLSANQTAEAIRARLIAAARGQA